MHGHGIDSKFLLAYAYMSNGRAERMVGTIKKSLDRLAEGNERDWEEDLSKEIYGYHPRPLDVWYFSYELMYGKPPRLV